MRSCRPGFVWTIQIAAVVGGHMLGAWGGHVVAAWSSSSGARSHRTREVPLAVIMVALTTLTLWSLGQALIVEAPAGVPPAAVEYRRSPAVADRPNRTPRNPLRPAVLRFGVRNRIVRAK